MQYIECIHCHKRYPANRKLRAAIGRRVRCTECWKSFPIIVYEVSASEKSAPDPAGEKGPDFVEGFEDIDLDLPNP